MFAINTKGQTGGTTTEAFADMKTGTVSSADMKPTSGSSSETLTLLQVSLEKQIAEHLAQKRRKSVQKGEKVDENSMIEEWLQGDEDGTKSTNFLYGQAEDAFSFLATPPGTGSQGSTNSNEKTQKKQASKAGQHYLGVF